MSKDEPELEDLEGDAEVKNGSHHPVITRSTRPCCAWLPQRYILAMLSFVGFLIVYALRVNLSVAIVLMDNSTSTRSHHAAPVFKWTDAEQGLVLSAFFYGYVLTQIPGGWLAEHIGGKWVLGVGVVMTSLITLLTPLAAFTNVWLLVTVRALEGLFEGVTFPAIYAMLGKWSPPNERGRLIALSTAGMFLGNVVSFPLSAVLCEYGFDGGWPSVFYVFGSTGVIWFILWAFLVSSSPATHPRISAKERLYIESNLALENSRPKKKTPWLRILSSRPVWGLIIVSSCDTWGFYVLLMCMPTFIQQILGCKHNISILMNGVYSSIPYILLFVVASVSGAFGDYVRTHWLSKTTAGKLFTVNGLLIPPIALLLCGYFGKTIPLVILFLSIGVGINGVNIAGYKSNTLDVGAIHAGALMGIMNTFANLTGVVAPFVTKLIAATPKSSKCSEEYISTLTEEWQQVFIVAAEIYAFGAITYVILGSGEKQPWTEEGEERESRGLQDSSNPQPRAVSSYIVISKDGERSPLLGNSIGS